MSINSLLSILPPPKEPVESTSSVGWGPVTAFYGESLPCSYMKFIEVYGSGIVGDWITIYNPFSSNSHINLLSMFSADLSAIAAIKKEFPELCPYPLMFEPGGLLPWGTSVQGDIFCWLTEGPSGFWKTVIFGRHSDPEMFEVGFSEFLLEALQGTIKSNALPEDLPDRQSVFSPLNPS